MVYTFIEIDFQIARFCEKKLTSLYGKSIPSCLRIKLSIKSILLPAGYIVSAKHQTKIMKRSILFANILLICVAQYCQAGFAQTPGDQAASLNKKRL